MLTGLLGRLFGEREKAFDREAALAGMEELLITADAGTDTAAEILKRLKKAAPDSAGELRRSVREILLSFAPVTDPASLLFSPGGLRIVLFTGVNGTGKTTSLAKTGRLLKASGKKVAVAAADTFRAGAVEQAAVWCERLGLTCFKREQGSDGAAVVFDAVRDSIRTGMDVLLVDTAGRMHTNEGLMREMEKLDRTALKAAASSPGASVLRFIVVDGQTGQNAFHQVRDFAKIFPLAGIVLTKTDSGFKSGIILRLVRETSIAVAFLCDGESADDIRRFDWTEYVDRLLE